MPPARLVVMALLACAASGPTVLAQTGAVTAAWDRSYHPDHAGYMLYYGPAPGVYTAVLDVGDVTSHHVTVPEGLTYYFMVRSYRRDGVLSSDSNLASGGVFTDAAIVQGVTPVKAAHFIELRTRIDAQRLARGLLPYAWSAGVTGGMLIQAQHVTEMHTALNEAYERADIPMPVYAPVARGALIRAQDIAGLRSAIVALEASYP
jgi:hypothetical protein